ncbi:MAG: AMP-binding protein [Pseudomonadota bacterium]
MAVFEPRVRDIALPDVTITERLFEGLTARGDAAAIIDGTNGAEISGNALMDRIRRMAGGLTSAGLAPGKVIALLAPNVPDYAVVFHGVAYAGGTVTTMNPTYTAPEIHHQLLDSDAQALVTVPALADVAREAMKGTKATELIVIGGADGAQSLDAFLGEPLTAQVPVDLDEFIVVLPYSSGTTGRPKGVMLTHRNMVVNVEQANYTSPILPSDTVIAFLPFFHIYGMTVLMNMFLAQSARLVTMPRFDLPQFLELIQTYRATRLYIVPPVALALAKHPLVDDYDVSSVRTIFSGAAPLGPETETLVGTRMDAQSIQGYGMTEMSPISHATWSDAVRHGSSGQAVPGTFCRIVDPSSGADMAPGQEGELWVKGPQVMKGYLGRPDATAESKTPDGWLKTGDLAVIDEDGFMFIRDRLKELIKYKGFQVAPAEVEEALISHQGVIDAAVIGRPDEEAGELPIAFIVPAPGSEMNEAVLADHCEACLAHYKHPVQFRMVDSIPKSASGKILRRILKDEIKAELAD